MQYLGENLVEVQSHHADGAPVFVPVNKRIAHMASYLIGNTADVELDRHDQRENIELRPYQLESLEAFGDQRRQGATKNLLNMGMGLGKTIIALCDTVIHDRERQEAGHPPTSTLWMADSWTLVKLAMARLAELFPDVKAKIISGRQKGVRETQYNFVTFQTMQNLRKEFDPRAFGHIVVDESHHGPAPTYDSTIRYFEPDYLLGITGTPYRTDDKDIHDLFGETAYYMPMTRGIAEGWLAKLDYRLQVDRAVRRIVRSRQGTEPSPQLLHAPKRYEAIRKVIRQTQAKLQNSRTLVFTPGKQNSRVFKGVMDEAMLYDSDVQDHLRARALCHLQMHDTSTVVAVEMATEGLDIPKLAIIALVRYTKSRRILEQAIGRGVRKAEGKDTLIVLDFAANAQRLYMLHQFLDDLKSEYRNYRKRRIDIADIGDAEKLAEIEKVEEAVEEFAKSLGFQFTEEQLDIVEWQRQLEEAPSVSEGWRNARTLSEIHGMTANEITNIIKDLRLEGTIMRQQRAQDPDLFYSPDQQVYVALAVAWNNSIADWASCRAIAQETGRLHTTVARLATELGAAPHAVRIGSDQKLLPPHIRDMIIEQYGREGLSLTQLSIRSGRNRHQVRKAVDKVQAKGNTVGRLKNGDLVIYPPAESERILADLAKLEELEPAPPGFTSIRDAEAAMPNSDLNAAIKRTGLVPGRYLTPRNQPSRYLSPVQLGILRADYQARRGTTITAVSRRLGISLHKTKKLALERFGFEKSRLTSQEIAQLEKTPYVTARRSARSSSKK